MDDLISRSELIAQLEGFKFTLGDVILGLVVERVIDQVREMPGGIKMARLSDLPVLAPVVKVEWSRPGPCPVTPEQFEAIYADEEG